VRPKKSTVPGWHRVGPEFPLVSIAIPTYNRVSLLKRAVTSALAQDYPNLEVVISDNASTDATESLCAQFVAADSRIRYLRQASNRGPIQNFQHALSQSFGALFMWLADDDWLDPAYVRECAANLSEDPTCAIVGGIAKYYVGDTCTRLGEIVDLNSESPARRVLSYYGSVADNAIFYGLMRRAQALQTPLRGGIGGDWLFVADMAYRGKLRTLESMCIHRDDRGISKDVRRLAKTLSLSTFDSMFPFFRVAMYAFRAVYRESEVYAGIPRLRRFFFASLVLMQVLISQCLIRNFRAVIVRFMRFFFGESDDRVMRAKIRRLE